jgi:uncharacterized protein with von Willebrand factor type A (vWA) domain
MICAAKQEDSGIGASTRRRLAGFARTLRDNGFRVGLAETRDALAVLASPVAVRPASLKGAMRALFCATHSDWEKFDEIFEAFWRGRDMRTARTLTGVAAESKVSARRIAEAGRSDGPAGLPDQVGRGADGDDAGGRGRRQGASTAESIAATDLRHITDPAASPARMSLPRASRAPCERGWFVASRCAGVDGSSTCAAPSIAMLAMAARRSISRGAAARSNRFGW